MTNRGRTVKRMENKNEGVSVPFFVHENAMMHKDRDNKRMMFICLSLCITLIIVVVTLVSYYTSRTQIWNDTITRLNQTIVEVTNGKGSP